MLAVFFVGIIMLLGIDQASKLLVINVIKGQETVPVIKDVFHLTYLENRGAAWGMLQDKRWFLIVITVLVITVAVIFMIKNKNCSKLLVYSLTLLIGGALGNFTDRLFRGYVIDFLHFKLINFPVFNLADCFVVVGTFLLAYYLIFKEGKQ